MNFKFQVGDQVIIQNHFEFDFYNNESGVVTECKHHNGFNYYFVKLRSSNFNGDDMFYEEELLNIQKQREERLSKILDNHKT